MNKEEFIRSVEELGLKFSLRQIEQFEKYSDLLIDWNTRMNLTAIDDKEGIWEKHFYDSLLSLQDFNYQGKLADVGSGAGFPGMVLKIALCDLEVVLIEQIKKRCIFLNEVIDKLELSGIEVLNIRSEDYLKKYPADFDIVTARAVANLNILSELCIPLLKVGGSFIILRGANGLEELKEAKSALKKLNTELADVSSHTLKDGSKRIIAIAHKVKKNEKRYPRNYGEIKKKPL